MIDDAHGQTDYHEQASLVRAGFLSLACCDRGAARPHPSATNGTSWLVGRELKNRVLLRTQLAKRVSRT